MKTWKHPPKNPDVARYVECYWFLKSDHSNPNHDYPKLNPDPCGHLILADAGQPYLYEHEAYTAKGFGSHWIFPHCQTFRMDHSQSFKIVGVKFHIGALYALKMSPEQPVLDQVTSVDINTLLGSAAISTCELLETARSQPSTCCNLLDDLLLPWLAQSQTDKHWRLIHNTLPHLADTPIGQLGGLLHCSQRTLERSFSRVTGLTLKQCQSIIRVETILEHLYHLKGQEIDWASIAHQFAFSDQPHLIRYLKNSLGETPGEYARLRDFTIDIYGDFAGG
ncbi:MAG: helix-turn-helix domain-containing protein [Endozoicomonas sp.]